jgi:hypothetical protein
VTVAVSVFTLVSISLERYFAICQPLRSRSWQTLSHSYKTIAFVWMLSLAMMVPIAVYQKHIRLLSGGHKCIEVKYLKSFFLIIERCHPNVLPKETQSMRLSSGMRCMHFAILLLAIPILGA